MRPVRVVLALPLVLAAVLCAPGAALADVEVESESVYRSYDAPALSEEDVVLQPFVQSFRLTAAESAENKRISFETYFRGIGNDTERGPGFAESSRVYYAYLDLAYGRRHPMDLRIGRQMASNGGDLLAFDGVRFRYRGPKHVGVEAFGGTTVSGFGAIVPIGIEDGGAQMAGGTTGGLQVFLTGVPGTQARFGFRQVNRDGNLDRQDVVMDFAQRFWRMRAYGNAEFSTALLVFQEGLLGGSLYAGRATFVDFELFHYTPTFGAVSIFNVFHIEPYEEARFRVRSNLYAGKIGIWLRVGHSVFGGGDASESINLGSTARLTDNAVLGVRGFASVGYLGGRTGGGFDVRYRMMDDRLMLLAGATAAQAENDLLLTSNGTYLSSLVGASWTIPDRAELSVIAEEYSDDFSSAAPRLSASFRFKFGANSARRTALDESRRRVKP